MRGKSPTALGSFPRFTSSAVFMQYTSLENGSSHGFSVFSGAAAGAGVLHKQANQSNTQNPGAESNRTPTNVHVPRRRCCSHGALRSRREPHPRRPPEHSAPCGAPWWAPRGVAGVSPASCGGTATATAAVAVTRCIRASWLWRRLGQNVDASVLGGGLAEFFGRTPPSPPRPHD